MHLVFIALGIIGLGMFLLGLKWTINSITKKEIVQFNINEGEKVFQISKKGTFSICIIGGGFVVGSDGFRTIIEHLNTSKKIFPIENTIKYKFRKNRKLGVEYAQFRTDEIGEFMIKLQNVQHLIIKPSILGSKRSFQQKLPTDLILVLIKESISTSKKLFSIIFVVLGANMAIWGFILTFMPELIK